VDMGGKREVKGGRAQKGEGLGAKEPNPQDAGMRRNPEYRRELWSRDLSLQRIY